MEHWLSEKQLEEIQGYKESKRTVSTISHQTKVAVSEIARRDMSCFFFNERPQQRLEKSHFLARALHKRITSVLDCTMSMKHIPNPSLLVNTKEEISNSKSDNLSAKVRKRPPSWKRGLRRMSF
jgi:hypothetical protein